MPFALEFARERLRGRRQKTNTFGGDLFAATADHRLVGIADWMWHDGERQARMADPFCDHLCERRERRAD